MFFKDISTSKNKLRVHYDMVERLAPLHIAPVALKFHLIIAIISWMEEKVLLAGNELFPITGQHVTERMGQNFFLQTWVSRTVHEEHV